jgi:cytochrome c oxidase assembly factor CtaG
VLSFEVFQMLLAGMMAAGLLVLALPLWRLMRRLGLPPLVAVLTVLPIVNVIVLTVMARRIPAAREP